MFKLLIKMAFINLWRRRSRSLMLIALIALGLGALLFMVSLYDGMMRQMIDSALRSDSGHLVVQHKDFRDYRQLDQSIPDYAAIVARLEGDPAVAGVSVRLKNEGLISTARHSQSVEIIGIDPAREQRFGQLGGFITQGEYRLNKGEAILGAQLAEKLRAEIGSRVIVSVQSADKSIRSAAFKISGILRANNVYIDKQSLFVPYAEAERIFGVSGQASQIAVMLKNPDEVMIAKARFAAGLDENLRLYDWLEFYPLIAQSLDAVDVFYLISYGIVFLVVALGIFDVVLLSVLERVREFGIMMAVGTPFWSVAALVILESVAVGLFGFAAGAALGTLLLLYFNIYGLDFGTSMEDFGFARTVYTPIEPGYYATALIAVLIATVLAALIPVRVLAKLKPVEAIRFN